MAMANQPVSIRDARAFLERKARKRQEFYSSLYDQALRDFQAITDMIVKQYRPSRIWQWGSLLDRSQFRDYSDIDVAVEGVDDPERFFSMLGDAERLTRFPLDLLDLNRIAPEFAARIRRRGVMVYEA